MRRLINDSATSATEGILLLSHFRILTRKFSQDAGIATAEYAMTTVAACGFAGVLYKILTSDSMQQLLVDLIKKAFSLLF